MNPPNDPIQAPTGSSEPGAPQPQSANPTMPPSQPAHNQPPAMPNIAPLPAQNPPTEPPVNDIETARRPSKARRFFGSFVSWVVIPLVIVLVLHTFVFQAFYVEGNSMQPDFASNDYLIVNKLSMTFNNLAGMVGVKSNPSLARGDVIIFRPPVAPNSFFVKRIIGLPGETVNIKNGKVSIINDEHPQGLVLNEGYIGKTESTTVQTGNGELSVKVEQGKYFVMGDNRHPGGSYDSRDWGLLPKENIIGVAYLRLLPVSSLGTIPHPSY